LLTLIGWSAADEGGAAVSAEGYDAAVRRAAGPGDARRGEETRHAPGAPGRGRGRSAASRRDLEGAAGAVCTLEPA